MRPRSTRSASALSRLAARRIHLHEVEPGVLLEQVDARAGPLIWLPGVAGIGDPAGRRPCRGTRSAARPRRSSRSAVFITSSTRLELLRLVGGLPARQREHVVARLRLRFGGDRDQVLLALRRDVVDLELDLLLGRPLLAHLREHVVGAGHPVIPETDFELARRRAKCGCTVRLRRLRVTAALVAMKRRRSNFGLLMCPLPRVLPRAWMRAAPQTRRGMLCLFPAPSTPPPNEWDYSDSINSSRLPKGSETNDAPDATDRAILRDFVACITQRGHERSRGRARASRDAPCAPDGNRDPRRVNPELALLEPRAAALLQFRRLRNLRQSRAADP